MLPELRLAAAFGLAVAVFVVRLAPDFAVDDFEREAVDRDLLAPELRELPDLLLLDLLDPLLLPPLVELLVSIDHLPLITRLAASATASAISAPSFVALDSTDFAALSAVSAASIPASRIALRAFGLALIAAAAAARPAASISLLIAALASFSAVVLDEAEDFDPLPEDLAVPPAPFDLEAEDLDRVPEDLDAVVLLDLAITISLDRHNRHLSVTTVPLRVRKGAGFERIASFCSAIPDKLKGTAARCSDPLEHGQRPEVIWPSVQRLRPTNTPFRPPC